MDHYGPQGWWPAETDLEVIVGAVLTQNTNWGNVEKALERLKTAGELRLDRLAEMPVDALAEQIRPAGYFNVKARRLKSVVAFIQREYQGDLNQMRRVAWPLLRRQLLGVHGIGPETADSILLYALDKPVFVVDAYTRRLLLRHGVISEEADYHGIQEIFMRHLKPDRRLFNEYHALIVRLGKDFCRPRPACEGCVLKAWLPKGKKGCGR